MRDCDEQVIRNFDFKSDLLNRKQAAEYLGVTAATLAVWACTKRYNLPFVKIGRLVKYRLADLKTFINERSVVASNLND